MTTRTARTPADMLVKLSSRRDFDARTVWPAIPTTPRTYGLDYARDAVARLDFGAVDELPVCRFEPPPAGPDEEPEDDFQRHIDKLLGERRPSWHDLAFWACCLGVWASAIGAACLYIAR